MTYQKTRLEKLEQRARPTGKMKVVYQDPDGVYYDRGPYGPGKENCKIISADEMQQIRNQEGVLFTVKYSDDWKGQKNDNDNQNKKD